MFWSHNSKRPGFSSPTRGREREGRGRGRKNDDGEEKEEEEAHPWRCFQAWNSENVCTIGSGVYRSNNIENLWRVQLTGVQHTDWGMERINSTADFMGFYLQHLDTSVSSYYLLPKSLLTYLSVSSLCPTLLLHPEVHPGNYLEFFPGGSQEKLWRMTLATDLNNCVLTCSPPPPPCQEII